MFGLAGIVHAATFEPAEASDPTSTTGTSTAGPESVADPPTTEEPTSDSEDSPDVVSTTADVVGEVDETAETSPDSGPGSTTVGVPGELGETPETPSDSGPKPSTTTVPASRDPVGDALVARADAIQALLTNSLSLEVDARALLELDLNAPYAHAWLTAVAASSGDATPDQLSLTAAQARFLAAWRAFHALDIGRRQALVKAHNDARAAAGYRPQDLASLRTQLVATQTEFKKFRDFIAGDLSAEVDITPSLLIDVGHPIALNDLTLEQAMAYAAVPGRSLIKELEAARTSLMVLRLHYAGLDRESKQRLHTRYLETPAADVAPSVETTPEDAELSADEAEQARDQALRAAAAANTDELRKLEEARATLLGLQATVSQVEAALGRSRKQRVTDRKAVSALTVASEEIENMSPLDGDPTPAAGALLPRARSLYEEACTAFAADLEAIQSADSELPDIASTLAQIDPLLFEDERLAALRLELRRRFEAVRAREIADRWERLGERQADITAINRVRQEMLRRAPSAQRVSLNSFGRTGREEARLEVRHLLLDLRYWTLALPRRARNIGSEVLGSPVAVAKGALTLIFAVFLFIAWRRRAPRFVEGMASWSKTEPMSMTKRVFGPMLRYAPYVRLSLEWMALVYLLLQILGRRAQIPGVDMLWQIAAWILGGVAVIRLLHAMASESRYRRRGDPTAVLRLRSLRLVGLCATGVGLFLSVTATTVGRGTIYAWMVSTFWILAIPIALLLTAWWQPVIRRRLREMSLDSGLVRWVLRTEGGLRGFIAAGVGGVYLFISGSKRFIVRRASRFEITRRVLAYLVRREVAKQALRDDNQLTDIEAKAATLLDPSYASPPEALVEGPFRQAIEDLQAQQFTDRVTIRALVGEAGAGKTTVVNLLSQKTPNSLVVACPYDGFDALLGRFAEVLELEVTPETADAAVQHALRAHRLIVVDDAHHLVRPTIGGLAQLDRLLAFSRQSLPGTSWVLVIGDPMWQFVYRARAEGAVFDTMVELPRWDEAQIGALLRARSKAAGLVPTFDGLEVPRQATDDDDLTEHERREQGYYRILWDYVDGNPAVALHWWRRSLFADSDARVVVRLFHPPRFTALDALPSSVYFTLRALVQLDGAMRSDIMQSTQLPAAEIEDALRFVAARGFTEVRDGRLYLTRDWFRAVTRVLWRRHLVIRRPL